MKSMFLGTVVAVGVNLLVGALTTSFGYSLYQGLEMGVSLWVLGLLSAMPTLMGAFFGAWIAGRRFMWVALLLWAVPMAYTLKWGYALQQPAQAMGVLSFLARQIPMLSLGLAAAVLGAWLGGLMVRRPVAPIRAAG